MGIRPAVVVGRSFGVLLLLVAFQAVMEWCLEYSDRVASGWKLVGAEASTPACAGFSRLSNTGSGWTVALAFGA